MGHWRGVDSERPDVSGYHDGSNNIRYNSCTLTQGVVAQKYYNRFAYYRW